MLNLLTLEMLDDGTVIIEWKTGAQVAGLQGLRASVPSMAELSTSPLFAAFQGFKSGIDAVPIMQNLAAEMSTAVAEAPPAPAPLPDVPAPADAPASAPDPVVGA